MKIKCKNVCQRLLLFVLIISSISYFFYWIEKIRSAKSFYFKYHLIGNSLFNSMRYIKEIALACLLLLLLVKYPIKIKHFLFSVGLLFLGIIMLLVNNNFSLGMLISGIRNFLCISTIILFVKNSINSDDLCKTVYKTSQILILLNLGASILLMIRNGGTRYAGLFANAGYLGIFCVAASIYFMVYYIFVTNLKKSAYIICQASSFVLAFLGGSRSGIVCVAIIFAVHIMYVSKIKKRQLQHILPILAIIGIPILIYIANNFIERGSMLQSNFENGRFSILHGLLFESNIISLLFGNGLGFGTNSSIIIGNSRSVILDGTISTLIGQYGIIVTLIIISNVVRSFLPIIKNKNTVVIGSGVFCVIIILVFTINIFEMYPVIILLGLAISILKANTNNGSVVQQRKV